MFDSTQTQLPQVHQPTRGIRRLIEPAASIQQTEVRWQVRLQLAILAALTLLALIGTLAVSATGPAQATDGSTLGMAALLGGSAVLFAFAYYLSRTSRHQLGAGLAVAVLTVLPFGAAVMQTQDQYQLLNSFSWVAVTVLVSSILLPPRHTLLIALINFCGLIGLPAILPAVSAAAVVPAAGLVLCVSVLIIATRSQQLALEKIRRSELESSNRTLQASQATLEQQAAELTTRSRLLTSSAEVGRHMTSVLDLTDLLTRTPQLIVAQFQFYATAIFMVDDDNRFAVLRGAAGEGGRALKDRNYQVEIAGQSLVSEAISTRRPRVAQDVDQEALRLSNLLPDGTRSIIVLPLIAGGQVLGALDIQSDQLNAFNEHTVLVLKGLADQVAAALRNTMQYEAAQLDARQATALFEASQVTGLLGETIDVAVNRLFGVVAQRADFDTWLAASFAPDHHTYTVLTAFDANDPAPVEDTGHTANIDRAAPTPAALALLSRETIVINDPERDQRLSLLPLEQRQLLNKQVCAPAQSGDRLIGVVMLGRTRDKEDINSRDVQLAQAIASQLAMTVTNRALYDQAQSAAAELNQLMRLYTRQGWESFARSHADEALTHEYSRPGAAPLDPDIIEQVDAAARAGEIKPFGYDGQAVLGVPITLRGEVLGTLQVQDDKDRTWTDEELTTLQAVADQLAQSLEAARLLEESEASLQETTALYDVSRELGAAPSLNDALQLFVRAIHNRLQADQVGLVVFNETRGYGTLVAEAVPTPNASSIRIPMSGNPSYELLVKDPRSMVIADVAHDPIMAEVIELMDARNVRSMLLVPLIVNQKVVGSFGVDSKQTNRRFTEQEIAFCETLARQTASTIERYRLFEQTQLSLQETTALYQASRNIAAAQTPNDILRAIAEASSSPHIDRCVLMLIDPNSPSANPQIEVAAVWDRSVERPMAAGLRWTASQVPMIGQYSTEPLIMSDIDQAPDVDAASRYFYRNTLGIRAASIVRMTTGGRSLGWVVIGSTRNPHEFSAQEIQRYRTLTGQATVALENRRLFQDVEARVGELTVLTRISRRLASTLDLDEIMSLVVEESIGATSAKQGSIALYNEAENALETRVTRGYSALTEMELLGELIRPDQGLRGRMLKTGQAVLINDVRLDPDHQTLDPETRAVYVVPIRKGDLLLGALVLESPQPNAFGESDVRLIEALADQVAIAITNARAYEAEREAVERIREADRLKTQFLANMSHELRTPLNSIIGFSRVILRGIDGPLTELQQTDLTSIYNSGQHLLSLINNILDLSKIEAGKMELSIEPVNLTDIAKSVMSTAIALVKDKPVKLLQEMPADLPTVMADQTRVRQIMLNLVSNAAKFTEKGAITLRITPDPKEVYISVTDSGIGIPTDKLEHIFEEFTQVDASTTRRYGGTGLGLAITKRFVEMHQGRIWVESQEGVGSTFTFTLPREQALDEPEPAISLPSDLEARGEGKKLVLCIDDEPGVITLYKRYLEKQGYLVIGLTDPTKAVEEAKRLLPFAITLDVMMPNRDGWQVLADLKKTPEIANTPIVVCSIIQDKSKGYSLGAVDYLVKPITENELLGALERVNRAKTIRTVLVVDDEPDAANLLKRMLEAQTKYEVLTAPGGAQALAVLQNDTPDLVLLDLMMPDIDGFAVLDNIKGSPLTHHIPVIIVTAKELTADDHARLQGKTTAVFNKGMFTAEQLLDDIVTALQALADEAVKVS